MTVFLIGMLEGDGLYYRAVDGSVLLELAVEAAHGAGELLLERFTGPALGVSTKSTSTDLVSDADRESEKLIFEMISRARPDDGMLGEEGEGKESRSGLKWVVDPLDATVNYLYGIPWWAVSIAVRDDHGELAGVVHNPIVNETFVAVRGGGSSLNGEPISVSDRDDISKALIATGFAYDSDLRSGQGTIAARVLPVARDLRRMGSAALDLCSTACGRVDGFYEANLEEWDKAAGRLIVTEAGGVVSDLPAIRAGLQTGVIAGNEHIHRELTRLVGGE